MKKRPLTPTGIVIKNRLNEKGMTQYGLAKQLGMNSNYLYLIMTGERSGKKYMKKIAKELDLEGWTDHALSGRKSG